MDEWCLRYRIKERRATMDDDIEEHYAWMDDDVKEHPSAMDDYVEEQCEGGDVLTEYDEMPGGNKVGVREKKRVREATF